MRRPWRKRRAHLRQIETQADELLTAAHAEAAKTHTETTKVKALRSDTTRLERHNQIAEIIRAGLRGTGA